MDKIKFISALILVLAVILACNRSRDRNDDDDDESGKKIEKYRDDEKKEDEEDEDASQKMVVYGNPYILPNSPFALLPVRLVDTDEDIFSKFKREYFSPEQYYSKYSDAYNRLEYGNMYNVIYYNSSDSSSYLLLNRKALINKFYIPTAGADTSRGRFIIFSLIEEDYNNDKEIDEDDGETVYKCSIYGRDIRQISPDMIRLMDWEVDSGNDVIYLYITEDTNRDKKFNKDDRPRTLRTSITNSNIGTEILTDSLKNSMNSMYGK